MSTNRIDLHEPGLILRVYEAGTGARATDHPVKRIHNAYIVSCPAEAHADEHPSCYLFADTNHWHCYTHPVTPKGGNVLEMIAQMRVADREAEAKPAARAFRWMERELGLARELRPQHEPRARDAGKRLRDSRVAATYSYSFLDNSLAYQILRIEGWNEDGERDKDFRFRRPDGAGRWIYHVDLHCMTPSCACNAANPGPRAHTPVEVIPLRYRAIANAITRGRTVILDEGEKDALTLGRWNFASTSYPFGANYPLPADAPKHFAGAKQIIVPADADDDGRACAIERAKLLCDAGLPAVAKDLFPERRDGYDVSDFVRDARDVRGMYETLRTMLSTAKVLS